MNIARRSFDPRLWIVASLLFLWLAITVLMLVGRGDVENLLKSAFGHRARPDAFAYINRTFVLFWASYSILALIACGASWCRRVDVLLVLMIGPSIACLICLASKQWSDPNWHNILAVCSIGCVVSAPVACCYWLVARWRRSDA